MNDIPDGYSPTNCSNLVDNFYKYRVCGHELVYLGELDFRNFLKTPLATHEIKLVCHVGVCQVCRIFYDLKESD